MKHTGRNGPTIVSRHPQVTNAFHKPYIPFVTRLLLANTGLVAGASTVLAMQISLPNQSSAPGAVVAGPVALASQAASVSGVQFDVQYDNSAMSMTAALSTPASASGKNLYSVDLALNRKRFIIIGLNQNLISDGNLLNLSITVSQTATAGTYALSLTNVCGTDPTGNALPVTGTDGVLTVSTGSTVILPSNGVVNAGSFLPGPVAPGELVTLLGNGIGPTSVQYPTGSASNTILGGTSVLFDGTATPLLYASPNQINAIVPFGVSGQSLTQLTITSQGQTIAAVAQPVAATAPAIFTIDSSGTGAGAILNQDLSVNSPSNPAAKGSIIAIFATGAGQTNPPSVDGQVTATTLPTLLQPVSVQIGGLNAAVSYAGAAPNLVAGVIQVNATVPAAAPSGPSVPILLTIGTATSQAGVTLAVK